MINNIFEVLAQAQVEFRQLIVKICLKIMNKSYLYCKLNDFIHYKVFLEKTALINSPIEDNDTFNIKASISYKFVIDRINFLTEGIEKFSISIEADMIYVNNIISDSLSVLNINLNDYNKLLSNEDINKLNIFKEHLNIFSKQVKINEIRENICKHLMILPTYAANLGIIKGNIDAYNAHELILNIPFAQEVNLVFSKYASTNSFIKHIIDRLYEKNIEEDIQKKQLQDIINIIFNLVDEITILNNEIIQQSIQKTSLQNVGEDILASSTDDDSSTSTDDDISSMCSDDDYSFMSSDEVDTSMLGYNDGFML